MKKIFMLATFLCAMILTTTVHAENLVELEFRDNLGDLHYIDADSVSKYKRKNNMLVFYANFQTVYSDESHHVLGNHNVDYKVSRYAFGKKGKDKFFMTVSTKFYDVRGVLIDSDDEKSEWEKIKPDSIEEVMYETALKYLKS